jgi:DNA-binding protein HU-beta
MPAKQVAAAPATKTAAPTNRKTTAPAKVVAVKKATPGLKKSTDPAKTVAVKKAAPGINKANAAAAPKTAPQVTTTLKQMAAELAEGHDLPKKQAETLLGDLVALASRHLKKGDKIRLTGLGILQVRARPARMGRNPATSQSIYISRSRPARRSRLGRRRS